MSINSLSTVYMMAKAAWNVFNTLTTRPILAAEITTASYRPLDWGSQPDAKDPVFMQTLSNIAEVRKETNLETGKKEDVVYGYFFDAFLRESHTGTVRITDHPVQTGANISDHAYNLPDKLTLEIFVSDNMDCVIADQFSELYTKSLSAYKILRELKEKRQPLSIRTRLHPYENMLIETMTTNDDYKTANSLRCTIMLRQIIMAEVTNQIVVSDKPYVADPTKTNVATTTPDESILHRGTETYDGNPLY